MIRSDDDLADGEYRVSRPRGRGNLYVSEYKNLQITFKETQQFCPCIYHVTKSEVKILPGK